MFLGMGLEGLIPRHNRSKSFPDKETVKEDCSDSVEISDQTKLDTGYLTECSATRKKQTPMNNVRQTLKQEILQLEKRLEDQFKVRCTLEKALGYRPISLVNPNDMTIPQPTTELIKDIAVLELEVVYLEQYLLSLYRKAFEQQLSPAVAASASTVEESEKSPPVTTPRARFLQVSPPEVLTKKECSDVQCIDHELHTLQKECNRHKLETPDKEYIVHHPEEKQSDSSVHRCHSSLSQYSTSTAKVSSQEEELTDSLRACYSQPLSMMEYAESIDTSTKVISLAEHLGTRICDHIPETANKLSEDMVKCISAIYYKLADPPMTNPGLSSPSTSISAFSIGDQGDTWSPGLRNNSSFDVQLDNPFNVEGFKEFSGPYSTMVEVPWIYKENQKLADTEQLLQNFRSLICQLEDVDPGKLKHEEKLAFWINVHNALVMHAFLAYGIPQNNVKRVFLLLKAAYNVGGHTVSADTIQNTILGCRMSRPGQWFRVFFSSNKNTIEKPDQDQNQDLGFHFLELSRRKAKLDSEDFEVDDEEKEESPSELNTINSSGGFVVVATDKLSVKYTSVNLHGHDVGVIQANKVAPMKRIVYYFEIFVKDAGVKGQVSIGFTTESFKMRRQPGWEANSCGYHGDDGFLYRGQGKGEAFGPTYTTGDIVGAGINYAAQEFFFTKNGQVVGTVFKEMKGPLFPTVAVHSQNEEVHVNFGQKPFTFDLKEYEAQERMKQQIKIEEVPVSPNASYGIVRSYLLHYGYEDTLNSFDEASRSTIPPINIVQENGIDDQETTYALNHRKTLRQLIRDGEIDAAFGKLREWYPQIAEDNTSAMCFLLHCQKFIELVRVGALEEAVKYGRIELSSFFGLSLFEDIVQDCVALLAYERPLESAVGYLLKDSQREVVADAVNAMILSTNPNIKVTKNCLHSNLERLLRQLTACCLERRSLSGEQGEAFQLQRVLSSGKRS